MLRTQPALLYLVPACLGASWLVGLVYGDLYTLWGYVDDHHSPAPVTPTAAPVAGTSDGGSAIEGKGEKAKKDE